MSDMREWVCPECDEVRDFVQPPCADGHTADGDDCPEWVCVDCGTAVLAGPVRRTVTATVRRAA